LWHLIILNNFNKKKKKKKRTIKCHIFFYIKIIIQQDTDFIKIIRLGLVIKLLLIALKNIFTNNYDMVINANNIIFINDNSKIYIL